MEKKELDMHLGRIPLAPLLISILLVLAIAACGYCYYVNTIKQSPIDQKIDKNELDKSLGIVDGGT